MKSEVLTVSDVCESVSQTYRGTDEYVVTVNTSDVLDGVLLNHEKVKNCNLKGQFKKCFQKDDILYSEIRPANKRCALIKFADTTGYVASTKLMVIRAKQDVVLPEYLYAFLTSQPVLEELQYLAETRSGTFPQITFSTELAPLPILCPPLLTQRKIAAVLSSLDDKIETNNAICRNLEEQVLAIYDELVERVPLTVRKMEEVFDVFIGKTPPRKQREWFTSPPDGVTWVSIADMGRGAMFMCESSETLTAEAVEKFHVKIVPAGAVMLSFKLTVGRVAIAAKGLVTNEAIAHFVASGNVWMEYLYCYLRRFNYESLGNTSSIATAVNSKTIKAMPLMCPAQKDIRSFHSQVEAHFALIKEKLEENTHLASLRDTLLPRLMSGELDVSAVKL